MKTPQISLTKLGPAIHKSDALVIFLFHENLQRFDPALKKALGKEAVKHLTDFANQRGFKAKAQDTLYFPTANKHLTILVGLGSIKRFQGDEMRKAGASVLGLLEKMRVQKAVYVWPGNLPTKIKEAQAVGLLTEGTLLGAYEFDMYKEKKKEKFSSALIELAVNQTNTAAKKELEVAQLTARAVNQARDLQNNNSDDANPESIARLATRIAAENKLKITVIEAPEIKRKGLNLLYAVGRASQWPPKLVILEYRGAGKKKPTTALVGKGITFDTGGVCLKPSRGGHLEEMHLDMSGAAIVLSTLKLAAQLKLKTNILGVMPLAENAIDANAYKPGSIIRSYNGLTVEVANTDAEGRLILADALAYVADQYKPDRVIDVATLTGSVLATFASFYAGLISNNDRLANKLLESSERTSEPIWRLPISDDFRNNIKSRKADLMNLGKNPQYGDVINAAAFLEAFTGRIPWAHLDVAGTAMISAPKGYQPAGGTGFGVRLLIDYLKNAR